MSTVLNLDPTVLVKLFRSVVLAFKSILLDKVAVSTFCKRKEVSVIFSFVPTVLVKVEKSVVLVFRFILLDKLAVSAFCNKSEVSIIFNLSASSVVTSEIVPALAFKSILADKLKVSVTFNLEFKESVNFCWVKIPNATHPLFKLTSTVVNLYKESLACTYTIMPCFLLFTGRAFLVDKSGSVISPPLPKLSI